MRYWRPFQYDCCNSTTLQNWQEVSRLKWMLQKDGDEISIGKIVNFDEIEPFFRVLHSKSDKLNIFKGIKRKKMAKNKYNLTDWNFWISLKKPRELQILVIISVIWKPNWKNTIFSTSNSVFSNLRNDFTFIMKVSFVARTTVLLILFVSTGITRKIPAERDKSYIKKILVECSENDIFLLSCRDVPIFLRKSRETT